MYRGQEVVLLVVQHIVAEGHAWSHQLSDASLDQFLRQLRVFQLVADGYALASPDELRQIGVEGMMREACHLVALVVAVVAPGQGDAQDARSYHGILAVSLIEVTTSKQQHSIGMLCLQVEKLLHHWGHLPVLLCHLFLFLFTFELQSYSFFSKWQRKGWKKTVRQLFFSEELLPQGIIKWSSPHECETTHHRHGWCA